MSDQNAHALFSPSSGHKWMRCLGSLAMEDGLPETTSKAAEEGTAAHELAAWALTDKVHYCAAYEGRITSNDREVTEEMCEYVQIYVDAILARIEEYKQAGAVSVHLYVENRVDLSGVVGVDDQFGTSDIIILVEWPNDEWLIDVEDLKYGYNLVKADNNEQLMLYALAALDQYGIIGNFTRARMVIHQPRREWVSDWEMDVTDLLAFGRNANGAAQTALSLLKAKRAKAPNAMPHILASLTPGEKQCQWCKRKGDCPALKKWAEELVEAQFEDLTEQNVLKPLEPTRGSSDEDEGERLAGLLKAMPLLEIFAKGILSRAESFIFGGGKIPGYKIVAGKKGRRSWGHNADEVEETLKSMRLKQEEMYSFKLISPTAAEKLLKKDSPKRWKRLLDFIVQKDGQPSIAEDADTREPLAITKPEDDFGVVDDGLDLA